MAVNTWVGGDSGNEADWFTAANWNTTGVTNRVPTDADMVVIPNVTHQPTLGTSGDTILSLYVASGATIDSAGGSEIVIKGNADGTGVTTSGTSIEMVGGFGGTSVSFNIQVPSATNVDLSPDAGTGPTNVTINHSSCAVTMTVGMIVTGNLTITEGSLSTGSNQALTVNGDASVTGTLTGNASAISLSSLTINSGGTYNATSGTTTITSEDSGTGVAWNNTGGTFTHNNGLVKFTTPAATVMVENTWYDFEMDADASTREYDIRDTSGNAITILGNLTVTEGRLTSLTTSDAITIHGLTNVAANGTCWHDADQDTNKIIHNGLVTNLGTYKINDGTTVKLNGGIRQLGTLTIA